MIFLCYCRTFLSSSVQMTMYSNFNKFVRNFHTASLKPIKVNQSKYNVNFLLSRRHYQQPIKGERSRMQDSIAKGFELIYKERHASLIYTMLWVSYVGIGVAAYKITDKYILKNPDTVEEDRAFTFLEVPYTTNKYTTAIGYFVGAGLAWLFFYYSLRLPLRMYRKNNEIMIVTCHYFGPLVKKTIQCTINDIRPMASPRLLPYRIYQYDVRGKKYFFPDHSFRSIADLNEISNKEKLRTKLDDFVDQIERMIEKIINRKGA